MFESNAPPGSLREMFGTTTLVVGGFFTAVWIALFTHALIMFVPPLHAGEPVNLVSAVLAAIAPMLLVTLFGGIVTFGVYCARDNAQVITREHAH